MGSPQTEAKRRGDEGPVHEVRLSPFLIAKHEVTQEQWQTVMGDDPSHFKGQILPVERVSWDHCQEFCKRTGLLPREAVVINRPIFNGRSGAECPSPSHLGVYAKPLP